MDSKELANKVIEDIKSAPTLLDGIKKELVDLFHKIVIDNAEQIVKMENEDEFYAFLATIIDTLIVLPQPFESFDGMAIKYVLKKFVDPILDKYAGANWFEKIGQLIALNTIKEIDAQPTAETPTV